MKEVRIKFKPESTRPCSCLTTQEILLCQQIRRIVNGQMYQRGYSKVKHKVPIAQHESHLRYKMADTWARTAQNKKLRVATTQSIYVLATREVTLQETYPVSSQVNERIVLTIEQCLDILNDMLASQYVIIIGTRRLQYSYELRASLQITTRKL